MKGKRKLGALGLALLLGAGTIFSAQLGFAGNPSGEGKEPAEEGGGELRGLPQSLPPLPSYELPEGIQVEWEREEAGNEAYSLYLPKETGWAYGYEESRVTGEDGQGVTLAYRYGEQVEISLEPEAASPEFFFLEGETARLISSRRDGISIRMPDEDLRLVPVWEKEGEKQEAGGGTARLLGRSFAETEDPQGNTRIYVTGQEPGNDYVKAYDSAGNKLATMKFWVENLETGDKVFAFCLEPDNYTPKSGEWYTSIKRLENTGLSGETVQAMKKVLYYGYGGPGNIFEDEAVGLVTTHLALGHYYTGKTRGYRLYEPFLEQLEALEDPRGEASLTASGLTGRLNEKGELQTEMVTLEAFGRNCFYFDLPEQVTLRLATGEAQTGGRCMVAGGQSFYFTAPAGYDLPFQTGSVKGDYQEPAMYLVTPQNAIYQTLLGVEWGEASGEIALSVSWENPKGQIAVKKTDQKGNPLAGAEFALRAAEDITDFQGQVRAEAGSQLASLVTDSAGEGCFEGLEPGSYTVSETRPPEGYLAAEEQQALLEISGEMEKTLTFVNKKNQVRLRKVKAGDSQEALAGAVFQIWRAEDMEKRSYITDEKGEILLTGLAPGSYQYQEITAPEGYLRDGTVYSFVVGEDGHPQDGSYEEGHLIYNEYTRLEIRKTDGSTGEPLEGAILCLRDSAGTEIDRWESGKEARLLEAVKPGAYVLEELEAPEGYLKAGPVSFTLEEREGVQLVEMKNYPYGRLTVSKAIRASDIIWAHGDPTFFFTVQGKDMAGEEHKYHGYVRFTRENIAACTDSQGMALLSWTFENIPPGTAYAVTEEPVKDYRFVSVSGSQSVKTEGRRALVDLTEKPTGQQVLFCNEKTRYDGFKHNDLKVNTFTWKEA